jgi:hypothetical protein
MPAFIMLSRYAWRNDWECRTFSFWTIIVTLLMPMMGTMFSAGLFVRLVGPVHAGEIRKFATPMLLAAMSIITFLESVLVAKWLGFTSLSTWVFRAGLDGDATYFSNALTATLSPHFRRLVFLIVIPTALVFVQWLSQRRHNVLAAVPAVIDWAFPVNLFSFYMFTLLFWPQAVSIHPYLYDSILVGPLVAWAVVNFASRTFSAHAFTLWSLALGFLSMFNLTAMAQAGRCIDCFYSKWNLSSHRVG